MKNYTIGQYLIMLEKLHDGAIAVSAIPDNGDDGYVIRSIIN